MRSPSEILLPADFSPRGVDVARYAAGVARHYDAGITLLHVAAPGRSEEARQRLNLFLSEELRGIRVKRAVVEGDASEAIVQYAATEGIGLIMMPTRGCGPYRRFLLGSVTAKVLHDVSCPVWTASHIADERSAASEIPKVMVCAMGLGREGEAILKSASELAAEFQARLIVAHAIPSLEFHPETYFLEADMRKALIGDAHARISRVLSGLPAAEIRVEGGNISTVVRSAIEDSRADLLVIGRASGSGMIGRLRTNSYELIRESPCPVMSI